MGRGCLTRFGSRRFCPLDIFQLRGISVESVLFHCCHQIQLQAGFFPLDMVRKWNRSEFIPNVKESADF